MNGGSTSEDMEDTQPMLVKVTEVTPLGYLHGGYDTSASCVDEKGRDCKFEFNKQAVLRVLEGKFNWVGSMFTWRHTPQGHNYWAEIIWNSRLSPEDISFLRKLVGLKEIIDEGD